eukprot:9492323-Lingulodinium_polyedra.AAC.1
MVAAEPSTGLHRGLARQSGHEARVASPNSCESEFVAGHFASRVAAQARGWPHCSAVLELSRRKGSGQEISK